MGRARTRRSPPSAATGLEERIVVPGDDWTGAHSWSGSVGTARRTRSRCSSIVDSWQQRSVRGAPVPRPRLERQRRARARAATIGSERLVPFVTWLRANGKKGILGEFAGGDNATLQRGGHRHADVHDGATPTCSTAGSGGPAARGGATTCSRSTRRAPGIARRWRCSRRSSARPSRTT